MDFCFELVADLVGLVDLDLIGRSQRTVAAEWQFAKVLNGSVTAGDLPRSKDCFPP
jgi:hypothetical protein